MRLLQEQRLRRSCPPGTFRETFIEEWYNNGLIEEIDSVINSKQKIHYPIVLPSESAKETKQENDNGDDISIHSWLESGIRRLGDSAPSPIFLQPKPIVVQKNFKEIPENWLENATFGLVAMGDSGRERVGTVVCLSNL